MQTSFSDMDDRHHRGHARKSAATPTAFEGKEGKEGKSGKAPKEKTDEDKKEEADEKDEEDKGAKEKEDEDEEEDIGKEHGGHEGIGSVTVEEEETLNLGKDADVLPLCEDLNPEQVHMGESCWSTCDGQCPNDVLAQGEGLAFDFDEIGVGHPGCTSHFECVGNHDRILCHAVQAVGEAGFSSPLPILGAVYMPKVPPWMLRQSPADSTSTVKAASATISARRARMCGVTGRNMRLSRRAREFL